MNIIFVLGKMLRPDGTMTEDFSARIDKSVSLLLKDQMSVLVISGGVTRQPFGSEAATARAAVPKELRYRVILEEQALSTIQNVQYARSLLHDTNIDNMIVVTAPAHQFRTRYLLKCDWPEIMSKVSFVSAGKSSMIDYVLQGMHFIVNMIDPHERIFLRIKRSIFN